ncbi:translation initiation factor IF-2-like [Pyrgilauda ruficollis]|uniref:translation initiation factor IF-2-like n=1 Tax=Pyrgilauda ruficollis TaxID=221976 RepID=UPI001B862C37|nr:translation initiation factor IF-2-like [Pyrgilauda ruficollis]
MAVNTVAVETVREAITEIKGCYEAAETGARASFPGVTQPAPSAPPARSPYTSTRKKHGEDCRLSAAAADSSASLTSGSSPLRGVRRRAVATACADSRSPARPGASLRPSLPRQDRLSALPQPTPQSAGTHDRRVTLKTRPGPHDRSAMKRGEGWAKPALGEPPAPERRRSPTRRSHHQATSGASQRHRAPPLPPARCCSGRPPGERPPRTGASTQASHRREMAAEESRCLLGSAASDSYPSILSPSGSDTVLVEPCTNLRFCLCLGPKNFGIL